MYALLPNQMQAVYWQGLQNLAGYTCLGPVGKRLQQSQEVKVKHRICNKISYKIYVLNKYSLTGARELC